MSGAALCGVSLSIPSPKLQSPLHVIFSAPSSHPLPPRIRPRRHSRAVTPADEMMSHVFDVYCLSLPGWRMQREYWAHNTLYYPLFKLLGFENSHDELSFQSINSILNDSQKINDICVCVFSSYPYLCLWLCLYDCCYWGWPVRLIKALGQQGRGQGVIVGIMATLACIIQQLPTSHTLHTGWYSDRPASLSFILQFCYGHVCSR